MTRHPHTRSHHVLVVLLLVVALGGCLGEQGTNRDPHATNENAVQDPTPAEAKLQARAVDQAIERPAYDNDDWFLLAAPRSPEGHIRAFEWQVPEGAVQTVPRGPPLPVLYLEFVPVAPAFAPGEDWALYGFLDDDGSASLMFALIGPTTVDENLSTDTPAEEVRPPPHASFTMLVAAESLADGGTLHFVLVGHGPADGELAFAFRTIRSDSPEPPAAANDFDAFVSQEPERPYAPGRTYDGNGGYTAFYRERVVPEGERSRTATANIAHEHDTIADEGGQIVRQEIASTAETGMGWSLAYAVHEAFGESSYWTLDVATQGVTGRANGVAMDDPLGVTSTLTQRSMGQPLALFMADGDGESHIRLTLDRASAGSATTVQHNRLPDTLETILGIPSETRAGISTGDADGVPWIGQLPPG